MTEQNYSNHTRWYPLFHFVVLPLLLLNLIDHAVRIYTRTGDERIEQIFWTVFSFTLILLALAARLMVVTVQDRVIRLEERLRYTAVLSADLNARCHALTKRQIIALRFAPDDELAALVARTLNNEFQGTKPIKLAIKNWRPDNLRA